MKAIVITKYGPPEVLELAEVPTPVFGPDEVLIRVHATSINPIDWKIRDGRLKLLTVRKFPKILGGDVAGVVAAVGSGVTDFKPGDAVYTMSRLVSGQGANAEFTVVKAKVLAAKPASLSFEQAAAVPLAGLTAYQAVIEQAKVQREHRVLINGASGGVGTFAVQMAKALGAHVTAVASAAKVELLHSLGVDRLIDYNQVDFTQEAYLYDLIYDLVGNYSFAQCRPLLNPQGHYVTTQPQPSHFLQAGLTWLRRGKKMHVNIIQPDRNRLNALTHQIETGQLKPIIDRTYFWHELSAAHRYAEQGHAAGKVVIRVVE